MSRRDNYSVVDRYDDRESDYYRRRPRDRYDEEIDIDITRQRGYPESRAPRAETLVKERDTVISDGRRTERGPKQPDFLREDYGRSEAGPLVVRREERDDDYVSRAPTRRRSLETVRSRPAEKEEIIIRERERDRRPPYPPSERGGDETEILYRDDRSVRSRAPPPSRRGGNEDNIDIDIDINRDQSRPPPPRSEAPPRSEYRERDVEEIRFRRGGGDRPAPTPPRTEVDREEIRIREERRSPPPRSEVRGRKEDIDIDIDIRENRSVPPPRPRSRSRGGTLVARKEEEWIVRRRREPTPPPPPRDYEKEEIIIRRKERTPSPEPPPREPTPEPAPPPPPEPIIRPPIIQEVITHHRHIDHGFERARSPTPPPPPAPPSPPREENLEIEIRRQGTRNGKAYEEDIIFERDINEGPRRPRERDREVSRRRSISASTRRRSPSAPPPGPGGMVRRRYDDDVAAEADYYNRRVRERAYPGEAYNGATRDWGLVDVPPGTERVRMDGMGGGAQEITWDRYKGERRGKFITGDRAYEETWENGYSSPPPAALPPPPRERAREEIDIDINIDRGGARSAAPREKEEIRITEKRIDEGTTKGRTKDKMWTEITKDLVIKEAIDEVGYEYEETDEFFYVIEYLRYEDVLRLVEISEDIRRERRERIREIQWEREELERMPKMLPPPPPPVPAPPRGKYEERIYERDYIYDREGRRWR